MKEFNIAYVGRRIIADNRYYLSASGKHGSNYDLFFLDKRTNELSEFYFDNRVDCYKEFNRIKKLYQIGTRK